MAQIDLELELPRAPSAPRAAREALRSLCANRVDEDIVIDAELVVSELASNALMHGHGRIKLRGSLAPDRLVVEVMDDGGGFERAARNPAQLGGWGLDIVDQVADRWGMHDGSTIVWAEIVLPPAAAGDIALH